MRKLPVVQIIIALVALDGMVACERRKQDIEALVAKKLDSDVRMILYDLIEDRRREEAIELYDTMDKERLSPLETKLLAAAIEGFRDDLSMQYYVTGLEFMEQEKYGEASEAFQASLRLKDDAIHGMAAKIQLANALRMEGKPLEAIATLERLKVELDDRALSDDVYWYLALSHYEANHHDEARSVLQELMRKFPDSQYYRAARVRTTRIQLDLYASGK